MVSGGTRSRRILKIENLMSRKKKQNRHQKLQAMMEATGKRRRGAANILHREAHKLAAENAGGQPPKAPVDPKRIEPDEPTPGAKYIGDFSIDDHSIASMMQNALGRTYGPLIGMSAAMEASERMQRMTQPFSAAMQMAMEPKGVAKALEGVLPRSMMQTMDLVHASTVLADAVVPRTMMSAVDMVRPFRDRFVGTTTALGQAIQIQNALDLWTRSVGK
jgi:hypothetical protein